MIRAGDRPIRLGLKENWAQFSLLVLINAFVGAMIGLERSMLPQLAQEEFQLVARTAILSFIAVFGITKAVTNYLAGRLTDRFGRKQVLVAGWIAAIPVPLLLMWAPTWNWVLVANVFLGISQGLTWSTAVIMKIDLVGPTKRGLAMGMNEFSGYVALAGSALATGWIAARYGVTPQPFYLGVLFVFCGLVLSVFLVRETIEHAALESMTRSKIRTEPALGAREIFWRVTLRDRDLASVNQAGLVNNLNDGMAWGLFPLFFIAAHVATESASVLIALYPVTWGVVQLFAGALSDRVGRKWLIATGMWIQAAGMVSVATAQALTGYAIGSILLGLGTALVYPTLLAVIGDVAHPSWRASAVGVYRFWRDLGYAGGALLSGWIADAFGLAEAILVVSLLTFASGCFVALRQRETLPARSSPSEGDYLASAQRPSG